MAALAELEATLDSEFLRALAEPVRVRILKILLLQGPQDVGAIAAQLPQERSVISRHLKTMKDAGLVDVRPDGRNRLYALTPGGFLGRLEDILDTTRRCVAVCCPNNQSR